MYEVREAMEMSNFCSNIAESVMTSGIEYPKTIVFG
jgi:hypothetical protein